ncbi:MAG: hypothetical protein JW729_10640 [Bacteroidales bacterium]|nr:hypothetical protein [Bacteroidales bacterium]
MKIEQVPQDNANMLEGKFKEPCYALDENGKYTTVRSVGWDPKNVVMQDAWDAVNERIENIKAKVISGELSPIAFYMEKNLMDTKILASYVNLWRWTVKKHCKMKVFDKLPDSILIKYAETFDIELGQLKNKELI